VNLILDVPQNLRPLRLSGGLRCVTLAD